MVENLIKRYREFGGGRTGDYAYYIWKFSKCAKIEPRMIPLQFPRINRTIASTHSDQGLQHFYPWFLSHHNCSENSGYLKVVSEILKNIEAKENKKKYTFLRGDVNIFMPWIRVFLLLFACRRKRMIYKR